MNWEAAKTWLIVAFVILDGLLGLQVVEHQHEQAGYVESYADLLANTKTLLSEHSLSLSVDVPQSHAKMPFLTGNYAAPDISNLSQTVFSLGQAPSTTDANDIKTPNGEVQIVTRGTWRVSYFKKHSPTVTVPKQILSMVWNGSLYSSSSTMTPQTSAGDSTAIAKYIFVEQYQSYPVFDAVIAAQIKNNKLLSYEQTAILSFKQVGEPKPTISALDALDSLANSIDPVPNGGGAILHIQLGYVHKAEDSSGSNGSTSADYWYPVWAIQTTSQVYYVNAYTGEVNTATL